MKDIPVKDSGYVPEVPLIHSHDLATGLPSLSGENNVNIQRLLGTPQLPLGTSLEVYIR